MEWSAPIAMFVACVAGRRRGGKGSRRLVFPLFPVSPFRARLLDIGRFAKAGYDVSRMCQLSRHHGIEGRKETGFEASCL